MAPAGKQLILLNDGSATIDISRPPPDITETG